MNNGKDEPVIVLRWVVSHGCDIRHQSPVQNAVIAANLDSPP